MNKRNTKKSLSLSTQTVRTMQDAQMGAVAGGATIGNTLCGCNQPTRQVRNTCITGCVQ